MTETVWAYAAGVIDSDGCIGVRRSTYGMRKGDSKSPIFSPRVCVKQVEPSAVRLLKQEFGGSLMLQSPSVTKGRPLHYWELTGAGAVRMLRTIECFLLIKREQALNCLELAELIEQSKRDRMAKGRGHKGAAPRNPILTAAMEEKYQRGRELNRVGVAA